MLEHDARWRLTMLISSPEFGSSIALRDPERVESESRRFEEMVVFREWIYRVSPVLALHWEGAVLFLHRIQYLLPPTAVLQSLGAGKNHRQRTANTRP